jgi:hypothetical protein
MASTEPRRKRVQFADGLASDNDVIDQIEDYDVFDRRVFENEVEAIECDRRRIRELLEQQYFEIQESLSPFKLLQASVNDLEAMQIQLVTELDDLRQVDPKTGEVCETSEYTALEQKFLVLLRAREYFTQKQLLDDLIPRETENTKFEDTERKSIGQNKKQKYTCFAFMFKKSCSKE